MFRFDRLSQAKSSTCLTFSLMMMLAGFDVAMNYVARWASSQGVGDLHGNPTGFVQPDPRDP